MRNDGKDSEGIFEDRIKSDMGKRAFLYRIPDTNSAFRKGKATVKLAATPSDYLLSYFGQTGMAEVKSCSDKTSFSFSNFTPSQNAAMLQMRAAGGNYWVFIHHIPTDQWYRIDAEFIALIEKTGKKSVTWKELEPYKW